MPDDTRPRDPKPVVLGAESVNGGRDRAERIRETCPEGTIVEHLRVVTTTYVDRLYADGLLSRDAREGADMRDAAETLRNDWLEAGVFVGQVGSSTRDRERVGGAFMAAPIGDEAAFQRYHQALAAISPLNRNVARRAIVEEQPVVLAPLRSALADLANHYLLERRR